jgi:hypothetical protein
MEIAKMKLVPMVAGTSMAKADVAKISEVTKNLIKSRAMIDDLWGCVVTSYIQVFPYADNVDDNTLDKFKDICTQLECEVISLIGDVMEETLINSNFEEI